MVTSRAVVGSSAISSFGSHASAMAIITRWRSAAGQLVRVVLQALGWLGIPTRPSTSTARRMARS